MTIPLFAEALEANRRGELSEDQRHGFGALAASQRRSALSTAALLTAGGLLVGIFGSPNAFASRMVVASIALAIAAVLFLRAVTGIDGLTRDVRRREVLSVEGAIGKRKIAGRLSTYILEVGDRTFKVAASTYRAAPDAGLVRVYYLPRSRKVVNFERLPNATAPSARDALGKLGAAFLAPSRRERNEARAEFAAFGDALGASIGPAGPVAEPADARPLADALLGTWSSPLMTVTFSEDGRVALHMFGTTRNGRWAVDGAGQLSTDVLGQRGTAEARIIGDKLTVVVDGQGMTFSREADD